MLVIITSLKYNKKFMAEFDTKAECDNWVKNHKLKGKDKVVKKSNVIEKGYNIILEEVKDNGEVEYILEGPAEYSVYYLEENPVTVKEYRAALDAKIKEILLDTDWSQLSDAPLKTEERRIYKKYREYVRNKKKEYSDDNIKNWKILTYKEYVRMNFPK